MKSKFVLTTILLSLPILTHAEPYPNVEAMLQAAGPSLCAVNSELCDLILNLDALQVVPNSRVDALQSLDPLADGSLTAVADGSMSLILSSINDRLLRTRPDPRIKKNSGISAGDAVPEKTADNKKDPHKKNDVEDKSLTQLAEENAEEAKKDKKEKVSDASKDKKESAVEKDTKKEIKIETQEKAEKAVVAVKATVEVVKEPDKGIWIQLVGSDISQKTRQNVEGYDAQILGAMIGRDWFVSPQLTAGLAGGYQHADAISREPSGSNIGEKRFQLTFYGGYNFICPFYLNGAITFAGERYDTDRRIVVPPLFPGPPTFLRIAQAEFDGWDANIYLEGGYVLFQGNARFIPKLIFSFSHFDFDTYFESNAFSTGLQVQYDSMNFLPVGGGFVLDYINEFENVFVVPEFHLYAFYDFIHDQQRATAIMLGGGFDFLTAGVDPAPFSVDVGAKLSVHSYKDIAVNFQYDFVARNDYHRHQAFIKVRYEWA